MSPEPVLISFPVTPVLLRSAGWRCGWARRYSKFGCERRSKYNLPCHRTDRTSEASRFNQESAQGDLQAEEAGAWIKYGARFLGSATFSTFAGINVP